MVLDRYDEPTKSLHVGAYIRHTALVDVKFPCEAVKRRKHGPAIQRVMGHFYGVKTEGKYLTQWYYFYERFGLHQFNFFQYCNIGK